ncbi:MAG: DegV family protein [Firmicutes bacterium]|nr:DegV family protein [Bacillota bacterium]
MSIQIITDSGADIPQEHLDAYGIKMVPLEVSFGPEEIYLDRVTISAEEFWRRMESSPSLPKTSQPSPQQFVEVFRQALTRGSVFCVSLSSGLSGTYQSACMAAKMLGHPKHLKVLDSLNGSVGQALLVIRAAQLAGEGISLSRLVETITSYRDRVTTIITLNTLENIVRGGRLSRIQGMMGNILDIKLIMRNSRDGKVELLEKVRGRKNALARILRLMQEMGGDLSGKIIGISHLDCLQEALEFKRQLIERYSPKDVMVCPMGSTMGTYAGKGGMIISF